MEDFEIIERAFEEEFGTEWKDNPTAISLLLYLLENTNKPLVGANWD